MATAAANQVPGTLKWVLRAGGLILTLSTVVGLMNLAAHHGVNWREYLGSLVQAYRDVMAPFYKHFVTPVFGWLFGIFHFHLTDTWKDVITVLLLLLAAANAESFIREHRSIVLSMFNPRSQFNIFSDKERETPVDQTMRVIVIVALVLAMLMSIGLMIAYPHRLGLPNWLVPAYLIALVGLVAYLIRTGGQPEGAVIAFFIMLIPFVPLFLVLDLVLTPLLAWRMSSWVVGLFGTLYVLNANFEKWHLGPIPAVAGRMLITFWARLTS